MRTGIAALLYAILMLSSELAFSTVTNTPNDLIIPAGETFTISASTSYINSVQVYGTLFVSPYVGTSTSGWVEINASTLVVAAGGKISADSAGYAAEAGPGRGLNGGGGSHAGYGAFESGVGSTGVLYGILDVPSSLGSGGGNVSSRSASGGKGGGYIKINLSQDLTLNGAISALGAAATNAGGGAGGSVSIVAATISGSGSISASGGNSGGSYYNGGGGGGRVSVSASTAGFTGAMTAYGGTGAYPSGAGTVYLNGVAIMTITTQLEPRRSSPRRVLH